MLKNLLTRLLIVLFSLTTSLSWAESPVTATTIPPDYHIVAGDALEITVWKEESLSSKLVVRPDGGISLPLIGNIRAEGLTADQLKKEIAKQLSEYLSEPQVNVSVMNTNQKAYVVGKVNKPGEIHLTNPTTVMQALSLAGGLSPFADEDDIVIIRRSETDTISLPFDYDSVSKGNDLQQNILLQNGDVIVVP